MKSGEDKSPVGQRSSLFSGAGESRLSKLRRCRVCSLSVELGNRSSFLGQFQKRSK